MDINNGFNPAWQAFQAINEGLQRHGHAVARHGARTPRSEDHDTETVSSRAADEQAHPAPA
ncbi:hypothetical protein [Alkalilimnicola ehrlichii]|uniref:Uncharacterized protein n=1 Tax=Alkalilimnicola ehrlichii TaxID=351052 RepID=A0A3E0X3C0_9GAMM|nr:hypothetical protein [Alkalilimnicola ehrlichii]RFA39340.1 hypothetical protein CAL65_00550 [Alkalilimnicola ehrlichii]